MFRNAVSDASRDASFPTRVVKRLSVAILAQGVADMGAMVLCGGSDDATGALDTSFPECGAWRT